ncbi:MAG: hypothetical protein ACTS6A_02800 [Candidatus Hodgkinia cicadicola]
MIRSGRLRKRAIGTEESFDSEVEPTEVEEMILWINGKFVSNGC